MDINIILIMIQAITVLITIIYVILIYRTIKTNQSLNQKNIFNEIIKQERELRIKLSEYRREIDKRLDESKGFGEIKRDYDTLLFNYYEYLAICLKEDFIGEKESKLYFNELLPDVRQIFEDSLLFVEGYARKEQYPGIQWLFKKWDITF